jgi:lipoprotein-anchoring transpeptidase ErfK/SrfK
MNKRLLLGIVSILVLIVCIILIIKKINLPLHLKAGKITSIAALSAQGSDFLKKGDLPQAKSLYQHLINEFPNSPEIMNWERKVEELNLKLLFSPLLTPKSILYEIKPGDTLAKIAKEFKTTVELIIKSNNIKDDKILPGRKIKVWTAPFSIVVDKSQNTLILKTDEEIIKTYIVSTGINNSTPVGNFKIINKLTQPTWFKAGAVVAPNSPENILGSRWLGFDFPGYGIHGTSDPGNLGKQITQGCIRMSNSDIEELYAIVPVGTEVTVVD